jgi:hypothetical protein
MIPKLCLNFLRSIQEEHDVSELEDSEGFLSSTNDVKNLGKQKLQENQVKRVIQS